MNKKELEESLYSAEVEIIELNDKIGFLNKSLQEESMESDHWKNMKDSLKSDLSKIEGENKIILDSALNIINFLSKRIE